MTSRASGSAAAGSRGGPSPLASSSASTSSCIAEPVAQHPRIERPHARQIREQPPACDLPGRLLVLSERQRDTGGDDGRGRFLSGRLALGEQRAAIGEPRARPEKRQPVVRQLAREADGRRGERREQDRHGRLRRRPSRSGLTPSRSSGTRAPASSALAATTVFRNCPTGSSQVRPCRPSTSGGLLAPSPRPKRPPDARCRLAAAMAIAAGERLQTGSTVVAKPIREVAPAICASSTTASCVQPSAAPKRA